jgi:hypothetical protein
VHFYATAQEPTVYDFHLALEALFLTRSGEFIIPTFETYNDMLSCSTFLNDFTYSLLLLALTAETTPRQRE